MIDLIFEVSKTIYNIKYFILSTFVSVFWVISLGWGLFDLYTYQFNPPGDIIALEELEGNYIIRIGTGIALFLLWFLFLRPKKKVD